MSINKAKDLFRLDDLTDLPFKVVNEVRSDLSQQEYNIMRLCRYQPDLSDDQILVGYYREYEEYLSHAQLKNLLENLMTKKIISRTPTHKLSICQKVIDFFKKVKL